jgi:plastocyanin
MFVKKWLTGLVFLLAMILVVTTPGSLRGFAESKVLTQPNVRTNAIVVELNDNFFNPKVISIPNGRTTTLILKNKGVKEHTFTVGKLNIDVEVPPGNEKTITVDPKNPGTYELICRYHSNYGMVGNVIVK